MKLKSLELSDTGVVSNGLSHLSGMIGNLGMVCYFVVGLWAIMG